MKITLLLIGKTDKSYLKEGFEIFEKRVKRYVSFECKMIPDIKNSKNLSTDVQKQKEGELLLNAITNTDTVVLLDDKGKEFTSKGLAQYINHKMVSSTRNLVFIIGGPYGFSIDVYNRANEKLSLSKMTFSHQMVRVIFVEQLYRSFSIINNEPYHHE